jgi:hypothetical protein
VYEYRQLRAKEKAMTRTLYALAIAVVCVVFSVVSGTSQAAPIAPLSAVAPKDNGSAMLVSWHDGRGGDHRNRSGFRRGGIFAKRPSKPLPGAPSLSHPAGTPDDASKLTLGDLA